MTRTGVFAGFATVDDWFEDRLEHDERFLARIAKARESLRTDAGIKIEDIEFEGAEPSR